MEDTELVVLALIFDLGTKALDMRDQMLQSLFGNVMKSTPTS